ncbi:uncharacterized protein [Amphiura filiformis]|uniref:uncharacterized protein n=1 Tax=Amphiura filiformis TaxID=82378 RepID=UPI003B22860A
MNKTSSISFTLPISCQVCLGKVKQPVVCPNYHAFCSVCIELWLQHNQQCPTCRIPITPENPCKQVLGGPSFSEESSDSTPASTPALRRTRFDLLYKEYEDEIERLGNEVETLKTQKGDLERQLSQAQQAVPSTSSSAVSPSCKGMKLKGKEVKDNVDVMLVLTSKLKEATETYEKVKRDMDKMKEVNLRLRDENASLLRETGRLKQLVASRSPHKYERYAMSAQASKIDQCEREIKALKRALDRSDIYVEELENKNAAYKNKYGDIQVEPNEDESVVSEDLSRSESADLGASARESARAGATPGIEGAGCANIVTQNRRLSTGKAVRVKREEVDYEDDDDEDDKTDGGESSFQLEKPSPITPASCLRRLTLDSNTKSSSPTSSSTSTASSSGSGSSPASSLRSCTRQLNFGSQSKASASPQEVCIVKSEPSAILEMPNFYPNTLEDTPDNLDTTLSNLDYSITPEFEACTKLLKAAEERVHQRRQNSLEDINSQEYLLGLQPGSSTSQPSVKLVDYKSSYILADCDPTFQFNPVLVSQASASNSTSGLTFDTLQSTQRPPSAPAASTLINPTNSSAILSSYSTMPSVTSTTRPKSAPLNISHGASIQMVQQQPHINTSSLQNLSSTLVPVIGNPLQGHNTSAYLPIPQTCSSTTYQISSGTSYSSSTQQQIRNISTASSSSSMPSYSSQSQSDQDLRPRGAAKQQKTVYVLSGSRIAPLGDRRKRSSNAERGQHLTSSPSKTQKF